MPPRYRPMPGHLPHMGFIRGMPGAAVTRPAVADDQMGHRSEVTSFVSFDRTWARRDAVDVHENGPHVTGVRARGGFGGYGQAPAPQQRFASLRNRLAARR